MTQRRMVEELNGLGIRDGPWLLLDPVRPPGGPVKRLGL
jgi:hypothetical protein